MLRHAILSTLVKINNRLKVVLQAILDLQALKYFWLLEFYVHYLNKNLMLTPEI